jgi:hypothetical protein
VVATLPGHSGRVNAVKWIPNWKKDAKSGTLFLEAEVELISGSSDGSLITWKLNDVGVCI